MALRRIVIPVAITHLDYVQLASAIAYLQERLALVPEAYRAEAMFELDSDEDRITAEAYYFREETAEEATELASVRARDARRRAAEDAALLERLLAKHGLVAMPAADAIAMRPKPESVVE